MNKYEKIYLKAAQRSKDSVASWLDSAVAALAADLEEYTGEAMKIGGPYGLRAEVIISSDSYILIVTPDFNDGTLKLYYDTGEVTEKHQPNTIGAVNGFNKVQVPLPDTIEEIAATMTRRAGDDAEMQMPEIVITQPQDEIGWVNGRFGKYSFDAKVYRVPSKYGINEGCVSKLSIRRQPGGRDVVNYDRGWDIRPEGDEITEAFGKILAFLEAMPVTSNET